jgi:hypothetical protein
MELFQIFWDDQKKLFLEFKKNEEEQVLFLPDKIKRLNFRFEISKIVTEQIYYRQAPSLVSVKKIYHSQDYLSFSIDLDEIQGYDDLQFKILQLSIYLYSGKRIEYSFTEKFNISDIWMNEDCYAGFQYIDLTKNRSQRQNFTKERVIKEVKRDYGQNKEQKTYVYEKNSVESYAVDQSLMTMITESNQTLKNIESHLKTLTSTLQNLPMGSIPRDPPQRLPQRIPGASMSRLTSEKVASLINSSASSVKMLVIKEMKDKFREVTEKHNGFSIKDILKPMSDEEHKALTLNEEELMKRSEEAINNQIKRFQKQKSKQIELGDLKKPE